MRGGLAAIAGRNLFFSQRAWRIRSDRREKFGILYRGNTVDTHLLGIFYGRLIEITGMKKIRYHWLLVVMLVTLSYSHAHTQDLDAATTKRIIEAKNYIFKAQTVTPSRGSLRQLTSEYDLTVSGDSVIAYLPYFGRAYSAPINTEGGINFSSAKSGYFVKQKKNRWEITIEPGDVTDVQQLHLDIYQNGRANLLVNSINRQSISFSGYIVEGKGQVRKAF